MRGRMRTRFRVLARNTTTQVPGLNFGIPGIASAGAVIDVEIGGNLDDINMSLGLDACASILGISVCGSDLTSVLPITLIKGQYDFSHVCS